jgi:hypothetical protein
MFNDNRQIALTNESALRQIKQHAKRKRQCAKQKA